MDLENLTNKQLRQKCLEFELPNVPVTDSNRKILLRRLHAAMTGTTPKKPSTPKSTPSNRRKTVNATITTTVSSGDEEDFVINTKRTNNILPTETRRRQTVAPISTSPPKPKPSAPRKVIERIVPIGFENVANSTRINESNRSNITQDNRQRRSVSLSKTGVLTTSYSTETIPLRTSFEQNMEEDEYEEPEEDLEDAEMESVERAETASKVYTHPTYSGYGQTAYNPTTFTSPAFAIPPSQTANKLYPDLHNTGLQTDYYTNLDGMRASHSSSARYSNLGFTHNAPTSYMPSPPQASSNVSRQTISGSTYNSPRILNSAPVYQSASNTKRYTTGSITKRHTARAIDNEDLAASSSDDQYEAPYLSKFSRNLDNLQPEPIYKRTSSSTGYTPTVTRRRRGTVEDNNSNTLVQLWNTLEEKYHLKTAFYCMLCFVIAVFIYVFFLQ